MFGRKNKIENKQRSKRIVNMLNYYSRTGMELEVERETAASLTCVPDNDGVNWTFYKWGPSWQVGDTLMYLAIEGYPLIVNTTNGEKMDISLTDYLEGLIGSEWEFVPDTIKSKFSATKVGVTIKLAQPVLDAELPDADSILDELDREMLAKFNQSGKADESDFRKSFNFIIAMLLGAFAMYFMVLQHYIKVPGLTA